MSPEGQHILAHLSRVEACRSLCAASPALAQACMAVKSFQHHRFEHTYADLLDTPRYASTARYFLDELYGPRDYSSRDAQFRRVVPALTKLFPAEIAHTVASLAQLHALSEELDTAMAQALGTALLDAAVYAHTWRRVGRKADRALQISLIVQVGQAMDLYTAKPLLRRALQLMRAPARAAGLAELQRFLETGFDTFRAMGGADEFLATIEARETAQAASQFTEPSVADDH